MAGETKEQAIQRAILTKVVDNTDPAHAEFCERVFDGDSVLVYNGYVDDERNTDNAWIETTCYGFHCMPELAAMLEGGPDGIIKDDAWWTEPGDDCGGLPDLWAGHDQFAEAGVKLVLRKQRNPGLLSMADQKGEAWRGAIRAGSPT